MISHIFVLFLSISVLFSLWTGQEEGLVQALFTGSSSAVTLALALAGPLCLWSGVSRLAQAGGILQQLSRLLSPALHRIFPESRQDPGLQQALSANICANLLGLGNAATPMGIRAAGHLVSPDQPDTAGDSLCRLIVLNTASIQLIPSSVAAVRASLGSGSPLDILPAVWISSLCSASLGLACAWTLGRIWPHD